MISQIHRLPQEIERISGNKTHTPLMVVIQSDNQLSTWRLRVVVSKKISKKAVERNRIRRQVKAVVRSIMSADTPLDIICIIRKSAAYKEYKLDLIDAIIGSSLEERAILSPESK